MKLKVIQPYFEIETPTEWFKEYSKLIEKWGRTCYASEKKITNHSSQKFIRTIIKAKHFPVIEHLSVTVSIYCDRYTSHQLVRHRIGSYCQESQRYVNYRNKGYEAVCPPSIFKDKKAYKIWEKSVKQDIASYEQLLKLKKKPEDSRSVLPNAIKTKIIATYNLSMWRHIFAERAFNARAQSEIKDLMTDICKEFIVILPDFFGDLQLLLKRKN
jgi:thymidylate synthase (FAD)